MQNHSHSRPRRRVLLSAIVAVFTLATTAPSLLGQTAGTRAPTTASSAATTPTLEILHRNFVNPPNEARPMVRWWWFGLAVVKPEILRELQQMKADGIQGAEMAFEYPIVLDDPAKG